MKVILTEDVARIGKKGELISVKDGYYRNFLEPKNLAVIADDENLQKRQEEEDKRLAKEEEDRKQALIAKEKIEKDPVTIKVKTGEEGKLFGSVTNKDLANALNDRGIKVDKKKISFEKNIERLGQYQAQIKLFKEVIANVKLVIEEE